MNLRVFLGAGILLAAGTAVYVFARPAAAWFVPEFLHAPIQFARGIGGSFPTFAHTAALSLLTVLVLGNSRLVVWTACVAWTLVNVALEIGQHPLVRLHLVGSLPDWLERVWLLDRTRGYFMNGTFDSFDLVAAVLGGVAASAVVGLVRPRGDEQ